MLCEPESTSLESVLVGLFAGPAGTCFIEQIQRGVDLLALDEALDRLSAFDERKARAIELRYFAGMSVEETAELLEISVATLRRELRFAENWLCRHLTKH